MVRRLKGIHRYLEPCPKINLYFQWRHFHPWNQLCFHSCFSRNFAIGGPISFGRVGFQDFCLPENKDHKMVSKARKKWPIWYWQYHKSHTIWSALFCFRTVLMITKISFLPRVSGIFNGIRIKAVSDESGIWPASVSSRHMFYTVSKVAGRKKSGFGFSSRGPSPISAIRIQRRTTRWNVFWNSDLSCLESKLWIDVGTHDGTKSLQPINRP